MGKFGREGRRGRDRDFRDREFERFKPFDNSRRSNRDFDRRNNKNEMHTVVCDKCGQECEVPFKPTAGKPVYCDNCFRKKDRFEPDNLRQSQGSNEIKEINRKLDKIIEILNKLEIVEENE